MLSELEKKKELLSKQKVQDEVKMREASSLISEASSLDIHVLHPDVVATELTAIDIQAMAEITPVEILKFDPSLPVSVSSPALYAHLEYSRGLSLFVASDILQIAASPKNQNTAAEASKVRAPSKSAQKFWIRVINSLKCLNSFNALLSVASGVQKTPLTPILKEQLSVVLEEVGHLASPEAAASMKERNVLFIRDSRSLERHLIDASSNKADKTAAKKFRGVVEYLSYIRDHLMASTNKKLNHSLIVSARNSKDTRAIVQEDALFSYEGCFIFLDRSNYVAPTG